MSDAQHGVASRYLETLLLYYEEEIMGEAYFYALSECFDDQPAHGKMVLLAQVERHAADAVKPLLDRYNLVPRSDAELAGEEHASIAEHGSWTWSKLIAYMVRRYPAYMDDFDRLERMAPAPDLPALKFLTAHEVAAIDFANMEAAGDPDSARPLTDYLARQPPDV